MKYGFMFWCRPLSAMLPTIVGNAAHYSQHQKTLAYYMSDYSKTKCDFSKRNAQKKSRKKTIRLPSCF